MRKMMILAILLWAITASCAPDPRNQADADATRIRAAQDAADREQLRRQMDVQFERQEAERQAASEQWVRSWTTFVKTTMTVLTWTLSMSLIALAIAISYGLVGTSRAIVQGAGVRASLIRLDPETRQFPLMLRRFGDGKYMLTDINTGQTLQLDIRNPADRQMIAAANAIRLAGAVAHEARLSEHPSEVAMVGTHPVVVGAFDVNKSLDVRDIQDDEQMMIGGEDGN